MGTPLAKTAQHSKVTEATSFVLLMVLKIPVQTAQKATHVERHGRGSHAGENTWSVEYPQ